MWASLDYNLANFWPPPNQVWPDIWANFEPLSGQFHLPLSLPDLFSISAMASCVHNRRKPKMEACLIRFSCKNAIWAVRNPSKIADLIK